MSTTIRCLIHPSLTEGERIHIDGKNLSDAFIGAALGGVDLMALMDDPSAELPADLGEAEPGADPFEPLSPFIDKQSAFIGQTPSKFFPPADGLAAIQTVLSSLRGADGIRAVPSLGLREGAIYDLEQCARLLQAAQQQGASFTLYMEQ